MNVLDPLEPGRMVRSAIERDQRWVFTHAYTRDAIRERAEQMLRS